MEQLKFYTEHNGTIRDVTNQYMRMISKGGLSADLLISNSTYMPEIKGYLINPEKFQQKKNELTEVKTHKKMETDNSTDIVPNQTQVEKETTIEIIEEQMDSTESQITDSLEFETSKEEVFNTELKTEKPLEFTPIQSKKNIQHEVVKNLHFIRNHTKKDWVEKKVDLYDPISQSMTRFYFAVEKEKEQVFDSLLQVTELTDSIQTLVQRKKAILMGSTNVKLSSVEKEKNSFMKNLNIYFGSVKNSILKRLNLQQKECYCKEENCFVLDRNVKFEETITIHKLKRSMNFKEQDGIVNRRKFYNKTQNNVLDSVMDIQTEEKILTKKRYVA